MYLRSQIWIMNYKQALIKHELLYNILYCSILFCISISLNKDKKQAPFWNYVAESTWQWKTKNENIEKKRNLELIFFIVSIVWLYFPSKLSCFQYVDYLHCSQVVRFSFSWSWSYGIKLLWKWRYGVGPNGVSAALHRMQTFHDIMA